MARKMFGVGLKWINLVYVRELILLPASDWDIEYPEPRLLVIFMGGGESVITGDDARTAGFADATVVLAALVLAIEEFNG